MDDALRPRKGDSIVVEGHRVGDGGRRGTILQVHGTGRHAHYGVRWEDGHESIIYPGGDTLIVRIEPTRKKREPVREEADEPVLLHEP